MSVQEPRRKARSQAQQGQSLVLVAVGLFVVSLLFPIAAGLTPAELLPGWVGYLDVAVAAVLVAIAFWVEAAARGKIADNVVQLSFRIYRSTAALPLLLLVVFFLFGDRIRWNVLLPGLAWRAWVGLYTLPAVLSLWKDAHHKEDKSTPAQG